MKGCLLAKSADMEKQYVYVVECESYLSTESFHELVGIFAEESRARACIEDCAFETIESIGDYVDFEDGYTTDDCGDSWFITSKKYPDVCVRYFYDKVLVQ